MGRVHINGGGDVQSSPEKEVVERVVEVPVVHTETITVYRDVPVEVVRMVDHSQELEALALEMMNLHQRISNQPVTMVENHTHIEHDDSELVTSLQKQEERISGLETREDIREAHMAKESAKVLPMPPRVSLKRVAVVSAVVSLLVSLLMRLV